MGAMTRLGFALCCVLGWAGCDGKTVVAGGHDLTVVASANDLAVAGDEDLAVAGDEDLAVAGEDDLATGVVVDLTGAASADLQGAPPADLTGVAPVDLKGAPPADLLVAVGGGCGKSATTGYQSPLTITSASTSRTYALFVPTSYDQNQAYPLVFVFHGSGGTGPGIRSYYALEAAASGKAIFVYPTAISGNWDLEGAYAANKDLHLFEDLTAAIKSAYCIAPDRVFATGHSNGGFFSNILNCRLGRPQLRAIAPHAGSIYGDPCQAEAAGALVTHGDPDTTVLTAYGEYAWGFWRDANACDDTTTSYSPSPCVANTGCKAGHPVVWCKIPGIGHGLWDQAATVSWAFFDSFK